ncbi:MAG: folate-binding protein [Micromonosporaceae bacterium]|nr:folate-binding protein [Micromonosporaceae bacterium]
MTAVMAEGVDAGVPAHYGDPMREQRTLAERVGVVDRGNRGVVAVPGADRLSWLHDLATQHLAGLRPHQGTETLLLSPHGHIEHHAAVVDDGETVWLDTEPGAAGPLLDYLLKMRFFAQAEPRDATDEIAVLTLVGPLVDDATTALGLAEPLPPVGVLAPPGPKFPAGSVPDRPTARYPAASLPGGGLARRMSPSRVDLLTPRSEAERVVGALRTAGAPLCGIWAYEALRVAERIPRFGLDTDHRALPHEAGWLATSVHLEKGCYRGQETVARVHNLGRPPRRLVLLHLDGSSEQLPAPGTDVESDGRRVGALGSAARHFELGMIALATVKRNVPDDARLTVGEVAAAVDPGV